MQLLGEEVNTQVAVLSSLSRCSDADDLARTALQDEKVTNADVVTWDGDGVGRTSVTRTLAAGVTWSAHGDFSVLDNNVFLTFNRTRRVRVRVGVVVVVIVVVFKWVEDLISSAADTVAE
jgi:hypothetical protein